MWLLHIFFFHKDNFILEEKKSKSLPRSISQKKKDDINKKFASTDAIKQKSILD